MPRQARIDAPGALHHIIARGIGRRKIFNDREDRHRFIERLSQLIGETQTGCYAWALLHNHFHLLLKTGAKPIATLMRRLLTGRHILQPAPPPFGALISKPLQIDSLCDFVQQGIQLGKRPDLIGGELIRSAGGWSAVKQLRRANAYQKGDERILGDVQYVQDVLNQAAESLDRQYRLKAQGMDIEQVARRVAQIMDMSIKEVWSRGKYRRIFKVRSQLCYWAVRELGISMASLSRRLHISSAAVSHSVQQS
jgi:hypothetical protein